MGEPFSSSLTATGGIAPYTFSIVNGTLPDGLALDPATGAITGTATTAGAAHLRAQVTDAQSPAASDTVDFVLVVKAPRPSHDGHDGGDHGRRGTTGRPATTVIGGPARPGGGPGGAY